MIPRSLITSSHQRNALETKYLQLLTVRPFCLCVHAHSVVTARILEKQFFLCSTNWLLVQLRDSTDPKGRPAM